MTRIVKKSIIVFCVALAAALVAHTWYFRIYLARLRNRSPQEVIAFLDKCEVFKAPIPLDAIHGAYMSYPDSDVYVVRFDTKLPPVEFARKVLNVQSDPLPPLYDLSVLESTFTEDGRFLWYRNAHSDPSFTWWRKPDPSTVLLTAEGSGDGMAGRLIMASESGVTRVYLRMVIVDLPGVFDSWDAYLWPDPDEPPATDAATGSERSPAPGAR